MKITVRIGAAVDGDLKSILYEPLAAGATRARAKVKSEMGGLGQDMKAQTRANLQVETAARMGEERKRTAFALAEKKSQLSQDKALTLQASAHALAVDRDTERAKRREQERTRDEGRRAAAADARETEKITQQKAKDAAKAAKEAARGTGTFASTAAQTTAGIVSRGVGLASDVARGAGVSFDVASGVKKRLDLESAATNLANSGYVENEAGAKGQMQDRRAIMGDIQATGQKFGIGQDTIAAGLEAFVGKTGELETGRAMLASFAATAKATGADFNDVAAAAGAISNKLGEVGPGKEFATAADKAKAIEQVMLAIAGQGKVGAVEIKDMATQMEKLTSQASKFAANGALVGKVGTERGANIAMLGVLAQAARQTEKGSAAQATQSSMAFVRDLTSSTASKRIGDSTIYTDKSKTQIRDPQEIIKDILTKTRGDLTKLTHLLPNQNSRAVVNAFMDPYMTAYKGTKGSQKDKDAAGRAAVDEKFQSLKNATLSDASMKAALGAALDTTATKAEQFQQKLDQVVGDMADKVLPALNKLAPSALDAATAVSKIAVFVANNPGQAVAAAGAAGIAKATADAVAASMAAKLVAGVGAAGLGMAAITTLAIASVGLMAINEVISDQKKGQATAVKEDADAINAVGALGAAQRAYQASVEAGAPSPEAAANLAKAQDAAAAAKSNVETRMTEGLAVGNENGSGALGDLMNAVTGSKEFNKGQGVFAAGANSLFGTDYFGNGQNLQERETAQMNAEKLGEMSLQIQMLTQAMGRTLRVEVTNQPASPLALPGATTGPGTS